MKGRQSLAKNAGKPKGVQHNVIQGIWLSEEDITEPLGTGRKQAENRHSSPPHETRTSSRMKVVAACVAAAVAVDCASAFVAPVVSSSFASSSLSRSSRARAPGLRMSTVSAESKVR